MKFQELFEKWGLKSIKLNLQFAEMEFTPSADDEEAAWKMYVELVTRVATQTLLPDDGDEKAALSSIFSLFNITRDTLKLQGRKCKDFTKISIIVLNQVIRPFTAKWHKLSLQGEFDRPEKCLEFREELRSLQIDLRGYTRMLAEIAKVEDLTELDLNES